MCNELRSLTNRHLINRQEVRESFDPRLWANIARRTMVYYPKNLHPISYGEVVAKYTGTKKRMYYRAMLDLLEHGYRSKHAVVNMFVKPDRYPWDACYEKDPRAIQYRRPHFNIAMSAYISPFEHEIYESVTYGVTSGTRVIAKGLNNYRRAELILHKAAHFRRPLYVLLDHSRFDSTINCDHLRSTHRKYQRAFRSGTLAKLCKAQLKNRGFTRGGIQYLAVGTRMSGDPDTGCGNSVVNADCLWGFLDYCSITKYDFILDGDDSIVFVEQAEQSKLDFGYFAKVGFVTKIAMTTNIHQAEFCQSRLILAEPPVMVRNPERAMSHSSVSRRYYPPNRWCDWLSAVGHCELATNIGVPVMQEYGRQLASLSARPLFDDDVRWRMSLHKIDAKPIPVTIAARDSMYEAWGIPHAIQVMLEGFDHTAHAYIERDNHRKFVRLREIAPQAYRDKYVNRAVQNIRLQNIHQLRPKCSGSSWWYCSSGCS